jgi:hypothetical protein
MNSADILLFLGLNFLILILTFGLLIAFLYLNSRQKNVFSRLAQALELLGFTRRGWTRQISAIPVRSTAGYYSATLDGKPFEAHYYAEGGRRFKLTPYLELVLLGYFNARLAIYTPNWYLTRLSWMLPQKLSLPGYDGLEIRTADESSARFLLENEDVCQIAQRMLATKEAALLTIYPRDLHLTVKLSDPENVSAAEIQAWTKNMAAIATIAAALPLLDPEIIYNSYAQEQIHLPGAGKLILFVLLILLILPLVISALLLGR